MEDSHGYWLLPFQIIPNLLDSIGSSVLVVKTFAPCFPGTFFSLVKELTPKSHMHLVLVTREIVFNRYIRALMAMHY
ncbi:hypothetical protein H5410_024627 [Solanum commersonii]|uniref:Uncharacterized protein n=1 Tax=Solanum commersonii TaxID=4109 RepID=A0A9J5ZMK6_SOLCO|nr:hypothetical protein H5410_024627 [Solanum commersonii]